MLFFIAALIAGSCALQSSPDVLSSALMQPAVLQRLFSQYEQEQGRQYPTAERRMRLGLFRKSVRDVVEHNSQGADWEMEVNMFADMTTEEKYSYTGANLTAAAADDIPEYQAPLSAAPAAGSKDWRGKAVTKVKSQGRCGSCWVFSAVGALEGAYKNKGSILKSFSEQEGLDCSQRNGCGGGWMQRVYDYAKKSQRLAPMSAAKYRGKQYSCRYGSVKDGLVAFKISGYSNARGDSKHVSALTNSGPLSVAYTCTKKFFGYKGGIFRESRCSGGGHAVTSVGYTADYFRMKNSWGSGFGEKGYFRIGRGNVCGITNTGLIPTLSATGKTDTDKDETTDDTDDGDDDDDDNNETCVATDKNDRCAEWAAQDPSECTENWTWMTVNCRKSCKQCDCVDLHTRCAEWKGRGECEGSHSTYMTRICRKSCDKCYKKDDDDKDDGECQEGFKKCPDGSCVHEHWTC